MMLRRRLSNWLCQQVGDADLTVAYRSADSQNHRHCVTSAMTAAAYAGPKCYRLLTLIGINDIGDDIN